MWSDGSSWPGNMTVGGLATLDVEWIDLVYNTSRETPEGTCKTVCTVDNFAREPTPQAVSGTAHALRLGTSVTLVLCAFWAAVSLW